MEINQDNFPDELLDRILAKTEEIYQKAPQDELAEVTKEQLRASIQNTINVMAIGAKMALDYIKEKMN